MNFDVDTDGLTLMEDKAPELDVNLDAISFDNSDKSCRIQVGDTWYETLPVPDNTFPIRFGGDEYHAHLIFDEDEVEFYVVKNAFSRRGENDGVESVEVTDLEPTHGDILSLYLIGLLRKT